MFTNENTFKFIFSSYSTDINSASLVFHLDDNFHYKIKTDSIILLKDNNKRIKLNRSNLYRIRLWSDLINAKIAEKMNKLNMYQSRFKNLCRNIMNILIF